MAYWIRPTLVIVCTLIMIATNTFGVESGFSGEGPDPGMYYTYPTPFSPAPFTFAIWLPIFTGCCALAVYQALPAQAKRAELDGFAVPYCCGLLANAATPFMEIGWSNIVVAFLFGFLCLALVYLRNVRLQKNDGLFLKIPTTIFATWCGLATIVNFCQWLVSTGYGVTALLASGLVCAAMIIGALVISKTKNVSIAFVMVWAGIGIAFAQPSWNMISTSVLVTSLLTILTTSYVVVKRQQQKA
jgi:translocator protein